MTKYFFFLLVWLPLGLLGQSSDTQILDGRLNEGWTTLDQGWKYQKGDDLIWAQPSYDDNDWPDVPKNSNLNKVDDIAIVGENEIVWFRKKIKVDSLFTEPIIYNIYQTGASEIYLDGKLLHTFGVVSSNPETFLHKSAEDDIFILPLLSDEEQLLAVRYATGSRDFPLYNNSPSQISIRLATITVLNSPDVSRNNLLALIPVGSDKYLISLGATSLISILFFTLFLFFPKERINGYFALSTFCMSAFLIIRNIGHSAESYFFWPSVSQGIFITVAMLLMLFCIYRIFNREVGFWFWSICILFVLVNVSGVVYPINAFGLVVLVYFIMIIVLSLRSLKTNRVAALIFICGLGLALVYFIVNLILGLLGINSTTFNVYTGGLSFMLLPLSIAIYLGFSFSQRSKSLAFQLQAVKKLSSENTKILSEQKSTLEKEVTQRTADLKSSLENLKATQSQLIQSEKMASLGELTAGIAHEIQNPLNFVNNFSEVSNELIDEMNEEIEKGNLDEVKLIASDIKQNLEKINHHGKRADGIVKGMLQHSRTSTDKKEPTDINKLADEYLRLAYHGLRAKDQSFNATLKTDYDVNVGELDVIPQDLGRVILNLITNAFYACSKKKSSFPKAEKEKYEPQVSISTKKNKNSLEIKVTDNGNGMSEAVKEKIFQPFFTTKPTGEGTGLGLSMSYDIISKSHEGELKVETIIGEGTTFTIILPTKKI
jgi:two-component system NtrC family sensor kinase